MARAWIKATVLGTNPKARVKATKARGQAATKVAKSRKAEEASTSSEKVRSIDQVMMHLGKKIEGTSR